MDYPKLYIDFLRKQAEIKKPLKLVCDSSNGATGPILKKLLPELGLAEYTLINDNLDPDFKAHGPNPLLFGATDQLVAKVKEKKADLGAIFDADGDRVFFIDNLGNSLPSFVIASLLFKNRKPLFVCDELIYLALRSMNLFTNREIYPSRVGFIFIRQKIKELTATTGAEFSGHFYFNELLGSDSGIFAMICLLKLLSESPRSLSDLAAELPNHSIENEDLPISGKIWNDIEDKIINRYAGKGADIERRDGITIQTIEGWANVRLSNTEPLVRLYTGSKTEKGAVKLLSDLKSLFQD